MCIRMISILLFQILMNALMEYLDVIRHALTQLGVTLAHVSQDFTLLMQTVIHVMVLYDYIETVMCVIR